MNELAERKVGIAAYLAQEAVKSNVESVVGQKDAQRFISSVVSAVQTNPELAACTNASILSAALLGQSLNLPQSPQIGMFYLVPYENTKKGTKEATFQISYRGMLQLAMRSGQYKSINVTDIREGELVSYNPVYDAFEFNPETDFSKRLELPVIGYYARFELVNGYVKELYWPKERMEKHAITYSKSYRKDLDKKTKYSFWSMNYEDMAKKTMLRQLISKWGIMSVEMERGYILDQAVVREDGSPDYIDNTPDDPEKGTDIFEEGSNDNGE